MPARSSWKGYLKFSLVSVPVKAYSASTSASAVPLHQLHSECHRRIKYQKVCPEHGEVPKEEIVSGYEYSDGQYVVVEPDELKQLRGAAERAISVDAVMPAGSIDSLYFSDRTYYLVPDGAMGQKPFVLLQQALADADLQALAKAVLFGREELVLLRPVDRLLSLTTLRYEAEVTHAEGFNEEVDQPKVSKEEQDLTKTLVKAFAKRKVSIADYKDEYVDELKQLIEAKAKGKEIVTPPESDEPKVINLMDALKKSVAQASGEKAKPERTKRAKSARSSTASSAARHVRKRKTG